MAERPREHYNVGNHYFHGLAELLTPYLYQDRAEAERRRQGRRSVVAKAEWCADVSASGRFGPDVPTTKSVKPGRFGQHLGNEWRQAGYI